MASIEGTVRYYWDGMLPFANYKPIFWPLQCIKSLLGSTAHQGLPCLESFYRKKQSYVIIRDCTDYKAQPWKLKPIHS